jgi:hypothetical protein
MSVNQPRNAIHNKQGGAGIAKDPGPYVGIVMANDDKLYTGRLQVWIPEFGGTQSNSGGSSDVDSANWVTVSWASPFYGRTQGQNGSCNAYGMWMIPPDLGVRVLVMFANGDRSRGYWFACIPEAAHGSVPGLAKGSSGKVELEFDPEDSAAYSSADIPSVPRQPNEQVNKTYETQGLQEDKVRGPIDSSTYRETPSKVFGWSTPGGHTFVMDDGGEGTVYRLRSAAGNQLIMNDKTGCIYAINAGGSGWIEISAGGQIDVFGAAGINLATNGEVNIHGDKGVNIHTGGMLKLVGMQAVKISSALTSIFGEKLQLEGVEQLSMHSCKEIVITTYKNLSMKIFNLWTWETDCLSSKANRTVKVKPNEAPQVTAEKPKEVSGYQTTVSRAPSKEPYKEHDNGKDSGGNGGANNPAGTPMIDPLSLANQPGLAGLASIEGATKKIVGIVSSALGGTTGRSSGNPFS